MCSSLVRNAGGGGAMLAYGALEVFDPSFAPMPVTPDPQPTCEVLRAPDTNDWVVAMDVEIDNMHCLKVYKEVPRPNDKNIITPRWVFHRKFENGTLIKHKA
jgi:hypothetical protein